MSEHQENRIVSEKNMTVSESFITKYLSIVETILYFCPQIDWSWHWNRCCGTWSWKSDRSVQSSLYEKNDRNSRSRVIYHTRQNSDIFSEFRRVFLCKILLMHSAAFSGFEINGVNLSGLCRKRNFIICNDLCFYICSIRRCYCVSGDTIIFAGKYSAVS